MPETTSETSPIRPNGISLAISESSCSENLESISVYIAPGEIQLNLILLRAYSLARDFVSPIIEAFDAE